MPFECTQPGAGVPDEELPAWGRPKQALGQEARKLEACLHVALLEHAPLAQDPRRWQRPAVEVLAAASPNPLSC